MSDEAAETPPPAPPKKPKGGKLLPILMVVNLLGTGAAIFLQLRPRPAIVATAHAEEAKKKEEEKKPGPVVALDPFIVNLNEEGSSRYLKVTFEVEVIDEAAKKALELNKRVVRDDVLRYLSGLGVVDTQGEAGKSKIQAEVQSRMDKALGGEKVVHVFFTDFVVQ
jgi:flagellar FliL protein